MSGFTTRRSPALSRRALLEGAGALVVGFSLAGPAGYAGTGRAQQPLPPETPSSPSGEAPRATRTAPPPDQVDSWLTIGEDNSITIRSGKVELGTGIRTALAQIAADELYVPF